MKSANPVWSLLVAILLSCGPSQAADAPDKPKVIKFYASWCGPCRMLKPLMKKLERRYGQEIDFVHIDVDNPKNAELVRTYKVRVVPTVVFLAPNGDMSVVTGADASSINWGLKQLIAQK